MNKFLQILALGLFVSACSPLPRQAERLAGQQACCAKLTDIQFKKIELAKTLSIRITEDSPAFMFPEGKSYMLAVELPDRPSQTKMFIKTHRTGLLVPDSQIFCPVVTYLDDRMAPVLTTEELPLTYEPPGLIKSGFWYSVVTVPPNSKYAVIHTPAKMIGRPITLSGQSSGYAFFTGSSYVYVPGGPTTQRYPCGQTGELELELGG